MIHKYPIVIPIIISLFTISACQNSHSNLEMIGGNIPKDTALVFGKGIISTDDFEFSITFSPTMDELFFTRRAEEQDNIIYHSEFKNNKWTNPKTAFFTPKKGWDFEPHINPSGTVLYFGSTRPLPDSTKRRGLYQWKSIKTSEGWSTPAPLAFPFQERQFTMYLTSSLNNNLYFTTGEEGDAPEDWLIYNSGFRDGTYNQVRQLSKNINGKGKWIAHSFIAPDESYMIFDFKDEDGYGGADLYISFKTNSKWSKPYNLGPKINTENTEICASVSPDGKYLFFHRGNENKGDIYWIAFEPIKKRLKKK